MTGKPHSKQISAAIIGAGISGLSCATRLQKLGFEVEVYEKSRGVSGRMSTRNGDGWNADHGAQYFTARDPLFIEELNHWIESEAASIWHPRLKVFKQGQWHDSISSEIRYVGTPNMTSPGKFLARNLSIQLNQTINHITYKAGKWSLHSIEAGEIQKQFDWLVLALPAPQVLALTKQIDKAIEILVSDANMQGCWTVIVIPDKNLNIDFDAAFVNNKIISWVSRNNSKANRIGREVWTIHANPQWSQETIELDKDAAAELILDCAKKLGLDFGDPKISIHRWRYASGHINPVSDPILNQDLRLGFCGDWLRGGRVEGAWLSGYELASQIETFQK
ncbi:FAD-dependent oxidoreductase [Polynucleobacter sp. Latsch14-2]|jgi:predicted NAD/FAD-dependent oxidoreductase|uniref:NAD(P)/FAD-dependent oxidoreductase n=1 Tax=Polynucleobacter sp. Latsch14-2 TaxID=2576920 RepID=UPI001C0C708C|nr:FAD-dependent oxidoreductase [Polynucleobacter sp. Latsch14-2]MBU3613670.1 FAD-dependent oxidoreductase [Polynucleobacter sp. Latsch14-2]